MPLFEMSPNVQEGETARRKRSHDEFSDDAVKVESAPDAKAPHVSKLQHTGDSLSQNNHQPSPHGSPALTDAGSSTPARKSPSPQTPSKPMTDQASTGTMAATSANPAALAQSTTNSNKAPKRKLTTAEKEARDKEAAEKKKEREEQAAIKAVEKAKQEEEKKARAEEREEKRKKKEEEDKAKAQLREEKKKKKEEEQQRAQQEKEKKLRSQPNLLGFFATPGTPKKGDRAAGTRLDSPIKVEPADSPSKAPPSHYEKLFKPFFVKEHTQVAKLGPRIDDEAREIKSRNLDGFIAGQHDELVPFNAVDLFTLPSLPPQRGRLHHPVRHIMETVYKDAGKPGGAKGSEGERAVSEARKHLAKVPMKVIAFSQDVRPPYYGTMTFKPFALGKRNMYKLARQSTGRRLPLDYDYDSEAEWQEEEGEDLDLADDDEEMDDDDDFDGFLDDSEDNGLLRPLFENSMEPESTGLCFESHDRVGPNGEMCKHKMEFINDDAHRNGSMDPFSSEYWEPEIKIKSEKGASSGAKGAKMAPPPAPTNAFAALKVGPAGGKGSVKLVKDELVDDVKQAIMENKLLPQVALVEVLYHQFRDQTSRAAMKNTILQVAKRTKAAPGCPAEWELQAGPVTTV